MKKLTWGLAAAALAIPLLLYGRAAAMRGGSGPPRGEVVRASRRTIGSSVKATGVVKPRIGAEVKVGSRISGVVARLHVRVGDTVERGQLLAQLDTRELAARGTQAAAALAAAEATRAFARSDLARR